MGRTLHRGRAARLARHAVGALSGSGDPQIAALHEQMAEQRRERTSHNARLLASGQVQPALTHEQVRDVLFTYTAPELFEILVLDAGWTLKSYADFLYRGLRAQLLA